MRTSSAKAKGRRLVKKMQQAILETFPELEADDLRISLAGETGCDLKLSPQARHFFPYAVEGKNVERLNVWEALKQAEANVLPGTTPLLLMGRNHLPEPYVVLRFSEFMRLLR